MRARTQIWTVAMSGLAVALLATSLFAQVIPGTTAPGQLTPGVVPGQVVPGTVVPGQVVPGTVVPGQVQPGGIGQVQPGGIRQERAVPGVAPAAQPMQNAWAGQEAQLMIGHGVSMAIDGTVLRESGQRHEQRGDREQDARGMNPAKQLVSHGEREMQEGRRMIDEAGRDAAVPQQLRNAASGYINALFAICGGPGQQGNDRQKPAKLDEDDKATVCLINHSVCEAITASQLIQTTRMMGASSASGEHLQRHSQQMLAESRETLQRLLGRENAEVRNQNREGDAANRQGEASVATLAQRGREFVDALQTGGGQPAGVLGAPATGAIRGNTIPVAPGGVRENAIPGNPGGQRGNPAGGTTPPGGSSASESRGNTIPGGAGSGTNRGGVPGGIPGAGGSTNPTPR